MEHDMWIFTQLGFFSAVEMPGGSLKVRARCKRHLNNLKAKFPTKVGDIIEGGGTDYPYRIVVTKKNWAEIVRRLAMGIDYGNFKSRVGQTGDREYERALHEVWAEMRSLQPRPHYHNDN